MACERLPWRAAVAVQHPAEGLQLVLAGYSKEAVLQVRLFFRIDPDLCVIVRVLLDHTGYPRRHGRRGEHRLGLVGEAEHLLDRGRKARVQHLVRLVEHQVLDTRQRDLALCDEVHDPAWGPDHDVDAALQREPLGGVSDAAVQHRGAEVGSERAKHLFHLERELSRRGDDEGARAGAPPGQPLHHRDEVGEGFAGTGRGLDDHIPPLHDERDRLRLNRHRFGDAEGGQSRQCMRAHARFCE